MKRTNNSRLILGLSLIMIGCGTGTTEDKVAQPEEQDSGQLFTDTSDANSSNARVRAYLSAHCGCRYTTQEDPAITNMP